MLWIGGIIVIPTVILLLLAQAIKVLAFIFSLLPNGQEVSHNRDAE